MITSWASGVVPTIVRDRSRKPVSGSKQVWVLAVTPPSVTVCSV